jgi:hypothetical protein
MKYVCKCRVCGGTPSIRKENSSNTRPGFGLLYWYECQCGMRAVCGSKKSWARVGWNKDNADAENTRRLTDAINGLIELAHGYKKHW